VYVNEVINPTKQTAARAESSFITKSFQIGLVQQHYCDPHTSNPPKARTPQNPSPHHKSGRVFRNANQDDTHGKQSLWAHFYLMVRSPQSRKGTLLHTHTASASPRQRAKCCVQSFASTHLKALEVAAMSGG
jgi:hypothetical protein